MKLIQGELRKHAEGRPSALETLWIDVWQLSNQGELWNAFLQSLLTQVHENLQWRRRLKFDWLLFRKRVRWRKLFQALIANSYRIVVTITPILLSAFWPNRTVTDANELIAFALDPLTGGGASLILGLWLLVRPAVEAAREKVSLDLNAVLKDAPYEEQVSALQQLEGQFDNMVKAWVGGNGRLVIFIDDLDRCSPNKVPEVLEALKLFTTTPCCVYVLGMDHDVVRQGVATKYKFSQSEGAEYLEKIVQIPFHLPPLEDDRIAAFVREDYPDVCQNCRWAPEVFSLGLERNPRKVKRALNVYRTLLDLADVRVKAWEMDPVDEELVAKMTVIQSRFRALHEYLVRHPSFLLQVEAKAGDGPNSTPLKDDEKVGWVLLGEPEAEGAETETGLIDETGWSALRAMLRVGGKRFNADEQRDQISSYIYLTSTAEGGVERVRPHREERNVMLEGKRAEIEDLVAKILKRGADEQAQHRITQTYIERLGGVLSDLDRYTTAERLSANIVLDLLEERKRQEFEPEMVRIPAGPFLMGTSDVQVQAMAERLDWAEEWRQQGWFDSEQLQHEIALPAFEIGRYLVTNAEYQAFVRDTGHEPPQGWDGEDYPEERGSHPVVNVTWHDAVVYCKWLSEKTGKAYRLPIEAEWEKAARGTDGRIWPWGDEWDEKKLNSREGGPGDTTPVGQYSPAGDSPYGVADMAGNVWGWTSSLHESYPYDPEDGREDLEAEGGRVVRGGSWIDSQRNARCAYRDWVIPDDFFDAPLGFRVVVSLASSES